MTERETVPLCTDRFALQEITKANDQLADELNGLLKLIGNYSTKNDYSVQLVEHAHQALRLSATITGFIKMAGIE